MYKYASAIIITATFLMAKYYHQHHIICIQGLLQLAIYIKAPYSLSSNIAQAYYGKPAVLLSLSRYVETFSILHLFIRLARREIAR